MNLHPFAQRISPNKIQSSRMTVVNADEVRLLLKREWLAVSRPGSFTLLSKRCPKRKSEAIEQVRLDEKSFLGVVFL
jgi:hypothetical protein